MATETVPAGLAGTTNPARQDLEARRMVGLEAAWEIDALNDVVRDLCRDLGAPDPEQSDMMALRLKVRGLTARIAELASVAMSALDDDDTTANLFKKVHGYAPAAEVAHD